MNIYSSPPFDTFTQPLLQSLLSELTVDYKAYYIWTNPPDKFTNFINYKNFGTTPNVILGVKDLLDLWSNYNYWHDTAQAGIKLIDTMAQRWPNTNFVLMTSIENLHKEKINALNLQIVPWGGDWVNQQQAYQHLKPVINKNFNSKKHYISLNRQARDHRIVLLSYLFGQGLDRYGQISFLSNSEINLNIEPDNFLDRIFWEFSFPRHDYIRNILIDGYTKIYNNQDLVVNDYNIYSTGQNDNFNNFNNQLRPKYENSFVEIVSESSFSSPGYMLTEKTMHTFYACNFPIFLIGHGGVQHLRDLGFDVFDDIVNHHYDIIENPFDRITMAIELNRGLLTNADLVKHAWENNQDRFLKNIKVASTITNYYETRARQLWSQLKWNS